MTIVFKDCIIMLIKMPLVLGVLYAKRRIADPEEDNGRKRSAACSAAGA